MKIIYVHGISNKPPQSVLKCMWDTCLFGRRDHPRTAMAYWVNRKRYPMPSEAECPGEDPSYDETFQSATLRSDSESPAEPALQTDEQRLFGQLKARLAPAIVEDEYDPDAPRVMLLPPLLRRVVTSAVAQHFLKDSYDFLCVPKSRERMVAAIVEHIGDGKEEIVLIGHSQGSLIAYEALASGRVQNPVALFLTLGSPLGIEEVKDFFKLWGRELRVPANVRSWKNFADAEDVVAQQELLSRSYGTEVEDWVAQGLNCHPSDKHSATGYLAFREVQKAIATLDICDLHTP